jgi:RNA polymerase sigma factor (sigma-70 family)
MLSPASPLVSPALSDEEFSRHLGACQADLLRHARRLVGPTEADDVMQEALLLMWKRRASYTSGNFNGWAYTCLRNTCLDFLRKPSQYHHRVVLVESYEQLPGALADPAAQAEAGGQELAAEHVRQVMELYLPPHLSLVLKLKMLGHTYLEITQLLNISYSLARTRCHDAREQLRAKLDLSDYPGRFGQ